MCQRYLGGALLAALALLAGPAVGRAQDVTGTGPFTSGEGGGFPPPRTANPIIHLPTGVAGDSGFYSAFEFVMLMQTRAIGNQTIAVRGFWDITGDVTGFPGGFVGDRTQALNPGMFSERTYQPGFNLELGYRFDDGTRLFAIYLQVYDAHYSAFVGQIPVYFATRRDLANTFVSAPVFNFNSSFAGPTGKVANVPDASVYGIWDAASEMSMKFTQRYQQAEAGLRVPLFQTDYSRVYAIAGGRFSWLFERFHWRTVSFPGGGNAAPIHVANYTNTLSQRMYGPMVGCGHEIFVASQFSVSADLTGSLLLDVVKMRAKYKLGDETVQSKWGRMDWRLVPNANAAVNFWWYPVEGVQVRIGYQAMTFYNTVYMQEPVGFDFGNIDPSYRFKAFRLIHGFNLGIGFFF